MKNAKKKSQSTGADMLTVVRQVNLGHSKEELTGTRIDRLGEGEEYEPLQVIMIGHFVELRRFAIPEKNPLSVDENIISTSSNKIKVVASGSKAWT